jgi:hypothetical protein
MRRVQGSSDSRGQVVEDTKDSEDSKVIEVHITLIFKSSASFGPFESDDTRTHGPSI